MAKKAAKVINDDEFDVEQRGAIANDNRKSEDISDSGSDELPSRFVLYHGTSALRLNEITTADRLRVPGPGAKIAFTVHRSVAEYFACVAVFGDKRDRPGRENSGVVLALDGEKLDLDNFELFDFSDSFWGEGFCDWEDEIACSQDIHPLSDYLLQIMRELSG